ncbi:unnamed protein product [Arabis nemorensis]|uniref:Uncharacterized protein n=1 Tax=Arabis nemorensis TaxID=586526 RepID=A0A565BU61_9BRAS|nr:unnamed protein product [Arabis nemorensis]
MIIWSFASLPVSPARHFFKPEFVALSLCRALHLAELIGSSLRRACQIVTTRRVITLSSLQACHFGEIAGSSLRRACRLVTLPSFAGSSLGRVDGSSLRRAR